MRSAEAACDDLELIPVGAELEEAAVALANDNVSTAATEAATRVDLHSLSTDRILSMLSRPISKYRSTVSA